MIYYDGGEIDRLIYHQPWVRLPEAGCKLDLSEDRMETKRVRGRGEDNRGMLLFRMGMCCCNKPVWRVLDCFACLPHAGRWMQETVSTNTIENAEKMASEEFFLRAACRFHWGEHPFFYCSTRYNACTHASRMAQ